MKGLSIIVYHDLSVDVCELTEEEHNRAVDTTRKLPNSAYACDFWSDQWERKP